MPSKFELLRQGKSIDFEPGVSGRLNPQTKKLELSTGEVLDAANDPDFFPQNDKQVAVSRLKESYEKKASGGVGEFLHQYTSQGIPGGFEDMRAFLTQTGEEYANTKQAEREVSERISQESPYTSLAATGANIATDVALTRGMSAFKAAPILTAGSAGSRLLTEPGEVLGEAALAAGAGKILDKGSEWLSRTAQRRGASRALPGQQEAVRAENALGQQAVNEVNAAESQRFNFLKQETKGINEARLQQHQTELNARQNRMIESQNAFEQAKTARDGEVLRLKNKAELDKAQRSATAAQSDMEYRLAKQATDEENKRLSAQFKADQVSYEKALKGLPELEKRAQAEYSANVVKNAQNIEKHFPQKSVIHTDDLGVNEFIENSINKSGMGGSREAGQARRILNSIIPDGEIMTGRELSKRYHAIEDAIQRSSPEVKSILNDFKQHLGERLPTILEDSITYGKIVPLLKRTLESDVKTILNEITFETGAAQSKSAIMHKALANTKFLMKNGMTPANFVKKLQNGELSREMVGKILTVEDFLTDIPASSRKFLKSQGTLQILMDEAERKHAYFVNELTQKLQNKLSRYEVKATEAARNAGKKLSKDVKGTYGLAEPVAPPAAPSSPNFVAAPSAPTELPPIAPVTLPPPIAPPVTPPLPGKPSLLPEPAPPTAQSFTPQAEPVLGAAQGFADTAGDFLEQPLLKSNGIVDPLTRLAGLKYFLGKAALPLKAGHAAMKGLTSPTAGGEVARMTFKQGGIQAIEAWASKYPSYQNGILQSPQDRRSLTKEIEDASDIPLEQKAVIQSKVNRGKPIQDRL